MSKYAYLSKFKSGVRSVKNIIVKIHVWRVFSKNKYIIYKNIRTVKTNVR